MPPRICSHGIRTPGATSAHGPRTNIRVCAGSTRTRNPVHACLWPPWRCSGARASADSDLAPARLPRLRRVTVLDPPLCSLPSPSLAGLRPDVLRLPALGPDRLESGPAVERGAAAGGHGPVPASNAGTLAWSGRPRARQARRDARARFDTPAAKSLRAAHASRMAVSRVHWAIRTATGRTAHTTLALATVFTHHHDGAGDLCHRSGTLATGSGWREGNGDEVLEQSDVVTPARRACGPG